MDNAKRDENHVPTLLAVSSTDGESTVTLYADPDTHRLLTSSITATIATPAGGSDEAILPMGTTSGFGIYYGSGAPTVSAAQGSLYMRSDGTTTNDRMYVNTDGGTTWTAVITAA
jgi:hypothetical protein